MSDEFWKDIPEHSGYQISNLGNARSCHKNRNQWNRAIEFTETWRSISSVKGRNKPYCVLTLYTNDTPSRLVHHVVHKLVWNLFVGAVPSGYQIDHINGDPSDNRINNLRLATNSQNHMNQKPRDGRRFKGIETRGNKFIARIVKDQVRKNLGTFNTAEEAAMAYNKAAKELFGEFARLNPVEDA